MTTEPAAKGLSLPVRLGLVLLAFGVAVGLIIAWVMGFLRTAPPMASVSTVSTSSGPQANVTMQTVGAVGFGARPAWVSYMIRDSDGKWLHTTKFTVPAHTRINVTVEEFDSAGELRNPFWAQVRGTIGGTETVTGYLGNTKVTNKAVSLMGPGDPAHTFSMPTLGISVPLAGLPGSATLCATAAPCPLSDAHNIVKFSFMSPGPGIYRFQCFVPCGLGFVDGNGGPMQTLGYMMGFMTVVS